MFGTHYDLNQCSGQIYSPSDPLCCEDQSSHNLGGRQVIVMYSNVCLIYVLNVSDFQGNKMRLRMLEEIYNLLDETLKG